jgi:hypothetical protein
MQKDSKLVGYGVDTLLLNVRYTDTPNAEIRAK